MRITGWHVDGYGRFHDRGWSDLPPGLTVVHGPNEAGKSTLLSFLRSMLFGLKGQNQRDPAIRPLQGGEHGGRLWLADAQDRAWTIHRHRPGGLRLEGPDGVEHDEAMLTALLGNVGRDVFEAVFAFSLTELERLDGLEGDALRGQLFAATLTGGGSSAYAALDALQARIDTLYRARKSSPLRTLDERLKDLRQERTRAVAGTARHAELLADERRLAAAHEDLRDRAARLRAERDRLDRLDRLWAQLDPLRDARAERDALADGPDVPDDAVERANAVAERRAVLAASIAAVEERVRLRRSDVLPAPDDRLLAVADEVEDRAGEIASQRDRLSTLHELRADADRASAAADDAVADLGPGWTPAQVAAVDVSHPARLAVRTLADEAARADDARERSARSLAEAERQVDVAEQMVGAAEQRVRGDAPSGGPRRSGDDGRFGARGAARADERRWTDGSVAGSHRSPSTRVWSTDGAGADGDTRRPADESSHPSPAEVDAALDAIPDLRTAFADRVNRRRALRAESEALERVRAGAPRPAEASVAADGVRVSLVLAVGVLAVVVGVVLAVAGQPVGGAAVVVVGLLVAVVDRAGRPTVDPGGAADVAHRQAEAHEARVREQEGRVAVERRDLADADARLADAAGRAGLDPSALDDAPTTEPIERRAAALEALRDEHRAAAHAADVLADAVAACDRARVERARAAAAHDETVAVVDRLATAWETRRAALGLPDGVTARDAPDLLEALRRAAVARREADAAAARLAEADGACTRWTAGVRELLRRAGDDGSDPRDVPARMRRLDTATAQTGSREPAADQARTPDTAPAPIPAPDAAIAQTRTSVAAAAQMRTPTTASAPAPDHPGTIDALVRLRADVREALERRTAVDERTREEERDAGELRDLEGRAGAAERELAELLAEHGAVDAEALRVGRDETSRRVALDARIADAEAAVRREAGADAEGDALVVEARTGAVSAWAARRTEVDAELPQVEDEYRHAVAAATEATGARRALEDAVDLPRIDGEIERTRTEAARLMGDYRTLLRAKELIEATLDAFVRDQQPAVLRDASAWFARITDGRYREVRQALTDGGRGGRSATLKVVPASGDVVDPAVLSRGTREQLYLCLRLALARGTADRTGALPLVMDDVLVNFSPDRARAVADVVAAVAREQQVLFFTCHPSTRDLLVAAAGGDGARVEELAR